MSGSGVVRRAWTRSLAWLEHGLDAVAKGLRVDRTTAWAFEGLWPKATEPDVRRVLQRCGTTATSTTHRLRQCRTPRGRGSLKSRAPQLCQAGHGRAVGPGKLEVFLQVKGTVKPDLTLFPSTLVTVHTPSGCACRRAWRRGPSLVWGPEGTLRWVPAHDLPNGGGDAGRRSTTILPSFTAFACPSRKLARGRMLALRASVATSKGKVPWTSPSRRMAPFLAMVAESSSAVREGGGRTSTPVPTEGGRVVEVRTRSRG